jgi:hypothetical protein
MKLIDKAFRSADEQHGLIGEVTDALEALNMDTYKKEYIVILQVYETENYG